MKTSPEQKPLTPVVPVPDRPVHARQHEPQLQQLGYTNNMVPQVDEFCDVWCDRKKGCVYWPAERRRCAVCTPTASSSLWSPARPPAPTTCAATTAGHAGPGRAGATRCATPNTPCPHGRMKVCPVRSKHVCAVMAICLGRFYDKLLEIFVSLLTLPHINPIIFSLKGLRCCFLTLWGMLARRRFCLRKEISYADRCQVPVTWCSVIGLACDGVMSFCSSLWSTLDHVEFVRPLCSVFVCVRPIVL